MNQSILKGLENCYIAYQLFPFKERYNRFKEKKWYFLEGLSEDQISEEQIYEKYHQFVFFHFTMCHKIYPKVSKKDIIEYYERRKSKV